MFGRADQINLIVVSNEGGVRSGVEVSDEVTEALRVLFSDRDVVAQIQALLDNEAVLGALEEKESSLSDSCEATSPVSAESWAARRPATGLSASWEKTS